MKLFTTTRNRSIIVSFVALAWISHAGLATGSPISADRMVADLQRQSSDPENLALALWMPEEFWRFCMESSGNGMPEAQIEEALAVLRPYVILGVARGTIGPFGGPNFLDEASLKKAIRLLDRDQRRYSPLESSDISPDARNFMNMMNSMLESMLGQFGAGLHVVFFPAVDEDGKRIADVTEEGRFAISFGEEMFEWRLPLGSFLPPKVCPVDGEVLDGSWKFCPWHGEELQVQ